MKYNPSSKSSIMAHALTILGKSLRDLYPEAVAGGGKGNLGNSMEFYHFGYENNNNPEPDFKEIGYDLKCTPLDATPDGFVAGERLVLTMIDFIEEAKVNHYTESHFWAKAKLLLIFYLRIRGGQYLDFIIEMIRWWNIPEGDLKIIIDDWNKIHYKLVNGLAHELSEGDTMYLGACTKSSDSSVRRQQFVKDAPLAKPRAYCLKKQYMDWLVVDAFMDKKNTHINPQMRGFSATYINKIIRKKKDCGGVVRSVFEYKKEETFDDLIERKFSPYYGKTLSEISELSGTKISSGSKDFAYQTCLAILGIKSRKIEEFVKAGVLLKSVCVEPDMNKIKESMSFPAIRYIELASEERWEDSEWYNTVTQRFFFVVFKKSADGERMNFTLRKVFFWAMPTEDIDECEKVWIDTRDKVRADVFDEFMGIKANPVCHVRPHATNANDMYPTPSGRFETKKCFWLTNHYILSIVRKNLMHKYEVSSRVAADPTSQKYNKS